jgi:hypothetical protein
MNDTDQLDTFETALLAELRREVAEHPAQAPARRRPPRRRLRVIAAGAVATAAATVAAVGLTGGGPTASPAFAVDANPDGSVDLVVHRLDDADGLEAALAAHGIDATVHFVSTDPGEAPAFEADGPFVHDAPGPENSCGIDDGPGPAQLTHGAGDLGANRPERGGDLGVGGGYTLEFAADSVLFERPVTFYIGSPGSMTLVYPSSLPGKFCGFGEVMLPVDGGPTG